jgi:hypothetical protein
VPMYPATPPPPPAFGLIYTNAMEITNGEQCRNSLLCTVKKGLRFSRPQPGCH